jgi:soluble lytic murein transglycosylase-like protein
MMQILPSTGARWGLTLEDLYDPYKNIMFGAQYVSERINAYDGNWTLGLSAYNQGSSKVNRGSYSTTYATKVLETYNTISNYLVQNGFVQ